MFLQTKLMNANIALLRVGFEGTEFFACQLSSFASKKIRSHFEEKQLCVSKFNGYFDCPTLGRIHKRRAVTDRCHGFYHKIRKE